MTNKTSDLTVNGPGSPISFDKTIKQLEAEGKSLGEITVFIENGGDGFVNDAGMLEITVQGRLEQAAYFREQYTGKMPPYLYRYLQYAFDERDDVYSGMKYPTDQSFRDAVMNGTLGPNDDEWKRIDNLIRYSDKNLEAAHLIGFITMLVGALVLMKKEGKSARLFVELPETGMHPKRQARIMSMFHKIKEEYGGTVKGMSI